MSVSAPVGPRGKKYQYHSRSDRHSKVACWGILFDLLLSSESLRRHVSAGKVAFGINHEMRDFRGNRKKNFDLVLCTPRPLATGERRPGVHSFRSLIPRYLIALSAQEMEKLEALPDVPAEPVGAVLVALEAKACMTEHMKARPRLFDELNSSHLTIHGSTDMAIAAGFVMINVAPEFKSYARKAVTRHQQPRVAMQVMDKVKELPRRASTKDEGFDALAISIIDCRNDWVRGNES